MPVRRGADAKARNSPQSITAKAQLTDDRATPNSARRVGASSIALNRVSSSRRRNIACPSRGVLCRGAHREIDARRTAQRRDFACPGVKWRLSGAAA